MSTGTAETRKDTAGVLGVASAAVRPRAVVVGGRVLALDDAPPS